MKKFLLAVATLQLCVLSAKADSNGYPTQNPPPQVMMLGAIGADGKVHRVSSDNSGVINVNTTVSGLTVTQGSTTSGQSGVLTQGAVTTTAPSYTNGQTSPISIDPSGNLRVLSRIQDGVGNAITSDTRGTARPLAVELLDAAGNQITSFGGTGGTASNYGSAFPASGTASGYSDGINMQGARVYDTDSGAGTEYTLGSILRFTASGGSVAADSNSGVKSAGTLRVVLATDQPQLSNKLLVTPDSVALPANQSVNISQIAGVAPTTVGFLDIKGADGNVFVRQATAANLNATIVGSGTAGTPSGGVLTVQGAASMTKILVTPDSVALPANQSVNLAQVGGTNTVNGGLAGSQSVGGTVATNVAITDNPVNIGAQAVSSENAAITTSRKAQLISDLVGKLIVLPYANPENFVSGAITTAMTGTTTTSLLAAPAAGLRNYITQITVSNAHATVGTDVIIQDGSGGTTIYTIPAAASYGGAVLTFPTPLRQPTTATAIFCANVTTGASTKVSASGYKGI